MKINPVDPIYRTKERKRDNDNDYLKWLRTQQSAFSGNRHNIVVAHFRTAYNSGVGIKPLFSAIPLTNEEHQESHRIGTFKFANRIWWEAQVKKYQQGFLMSGGTIPEKYRL